MWLRQIVVWDEVINVTSQDSIDWLNNVISYLSTKRNSTWLDCIIDKWIKILQQPNPTSLWYTEQVTLACLETVLDISFIVSDIEPYEKLKWKFKNLDVPTIVDILLQCQSEDEVENLLWDIKQEQSKRENFQTALQMFLELDFDNLTTSELEFICTTIREFWFDWNLLSIIENNPQRKLRVLRVSNYPEERDIIIQVDYNTDSPYFYLEWQIYLKMKRIQGMTEDENNVWYYKWITFWNKNGIIITSGQAATTHILDIPHSINGNRVIILSDPIHSSYHLYLPDKNIILQVYAKIVGVYHLNKNQIKINEDAEDFEEQISMPWVTKVMRCIIDIEKWLYFDFNWENFSQLMTSTDGSIAGKNYKPSLH